MSIHGPIILPSGRKVFQVRWREAGRNRSRNFDGTRDGRKLAGSFDKKIRELRQAGDLVNELERRRVTVNDLYADWLDRLMPRLARKTADTYATQLALRILPALGDRRVSQLTVGDIERWIAGMRATGAGDPTVLKACTVLQALLSMAVRDGVITVNVVQQARKPGQTRTRIPYVVKPAQVEAMRLVMLNAGQERDVMLLELLAYAGLRPESEAVTLPWAHVRDRSLLIRDTKRKRERSIPMIAPLRESIASWRLRRGRPPETALVVPTGVEGPWSEHDWRNWRRRVFLPAAVTAGLPADTRPRDLRGSFATLLVHEGRSIVEVARQMGHSPAICLRDYAQVFDEFDPAERKPAEQIIVDARAAAQAALDGRTDLKESTA
jgi:site-specific recombinase XerD